MISEKSKSNPEADCAHEYFMGQAIKEAKKAMKYAEIPVGAVIVRDGEIIARGHNERERKQNSTLHAEMTAIRKACKKLGTWRLTGCDLYVTLEPCTMCAGALIQSRISNLYIGAKDPKAGAVGSVIDVTEADLFNHNINAEFGIREKECSALLTEFFKDLRILRAKEPKNKKL